MMFTGSKRDGRRVSGHHFQRDVDYYSSTIQPIRLFEGEAVRSAWIFNSARQLVQAAGPEAGFE